MADELTEYLIRGVQHGQQQALNEENARIRRDTQNRLTEAMAQRAAAAEAKKPRPIPADLIARMTNKDATPDELAGAFTFAAQYNLPLAKEIYAIGAKGRKEHADAEANQLTEQEVRAMAESNPAAATGITPGMNRTVGMGIYNQGNQNQRAANGPAGKGPPLSQEQKDQALIDRTLRLRDDADARAAAKGDKKEYWKGYATNESGVPEAVSDELSRGLYSMPIKDLAAKGDLEDGPAKGASGREAARRLTALGVEAQRLARRGMPLADAIEQVRAYGLPEPGENRKLQADKKPSFKAIPPLAPPPVAAATSTAPPVADPVVGRVLKKLGLPDTPENRARVAAIQARTKNGN